MQPGTIRAEEHFAGSGAPHRVLEKIEAANSGSIDVDVGVPNQMIDHGKLSPPIVGETAEMRDDEIYLGIFPRDQFDDGNFAHHVIQHRQRKCAGHFANLARNARVMAVNLDAPKSITLHRDLDHGENSPPVALRVNESESIKAVGTAGYDAGDFPVGHSVVRVKR